MCRKIKYSVGTVYMCLITEMAYVITVLLMLLHVSVVIHRNRHVVIICTCYHMLITLHVHNTPHFNAFSEYTDWE